MGGEAALTGHAPTVILLRPLGGHGQVRGRGRTHGPTHRAQGEEGVEGGGVADAGEEDLGRVVQRGDSRILGGKKTQQRPNLMRNIWRFLRRNLLLF